MCVVLESFFHVAHISASTCQNNATQHQLVGIFVGHLHPHVFDNFLYSCFNNVGQCSAVDITISADGDVLQVVAIGVFSQCAGVAQLDGFGFILVNLQFFFNLQRCDILGDVV